MIDWEENLAKIIHHTNLNLQKEFATRPLDTKPPPFVPMENQRPPSFPSPNKDDANGARPPTAPVDITPMLEHIQNSLKMEVDARTVIAERQLGALMQITKSTADDLERIRVECTLNGRQAQTIDYAVQKLQQETSSQKDSICHLQTNIGRDESWRVQTENQMLELRQILAALREQNNSTVVRLT